MRKVTKIYEVYTFDELSDLSKEKVLEAEIIDMLETTPHGKGSDNYRKAIEEAEHLHTPWFMGSYVYEYCREEIVECIHEEEREFLADGTWFSG